MAAVNAVMAAMNRGGVSLDNVYEEYNKELSNGELGEIMSHRYSNK